MRKIFLSVLLIALVLLQAGCAKENNKAEVNNILNKDWSAIAESAKGTTVNFYGWGGDERINRWFDSYVAKELKAKKNITLNRVPMNIDEVLNKLLTEKQASAKGTIDMVWINGENFYTAKKNGLLYGPFTDKLPNLNKYVDVKSPEIASDFGFPVEGYEAPYGKAQFVMIYDENIVKTIPRSAQELMEFVKKNPGKFTYPAPPDFTGSAFVRNIIYEFAGYQQFANMKADKETVAKTIKPAIDYLKELKPYLWQKGITYPATLAQLDNMFTDREVLMSMTYNPFSVAGRVESGQLPVTSNSFVFEKGTIGNTHFIAIPKNAQNKEGAMAVIDYILSIDAQASKYDPKNWGDLPVLDNSKLNDAEKKIFSAIQLGKGSLPQDYLLKHRVPEMPANLIPIIEKLWMENIPK